MKRRKSIKSFLCGMFSCVILFSGCQLVREVDIDDVDRGENSTESVQGDSIETISVTDGKVIDEDALCEYFYGQTREDLISAGYLVEDNLDSQKYGYECYLGFVCKKDDVELSYNPTYNTENGYGRNSFTMRYHKDDAAMSYFSAYNLRYTENELSRCFKDMFPQEELESCSIAEVIEICSPLAKACGYEDAEIQIYTMSVDALEQASVIDGMRIISAPNPNYNANNSEEMVVWNENHEAYIVIYEYPLNGLLLDCLHYRMMCIYVPAYEKIVYARAEQQLVVEEISEKNELITKSEALKEAIRVLKVEEEQIEISNISLVYSPRYSSVSGDNGRRTIEPCWRIDYILSEEVLARPAFFYDDGTIFINAVDGRENTYSS